MTKPKDKQPMPDVCGRFAQTFERIHDLTQAILANTVDLLGHGEFGPQQDVVLLPPGKTDFRDGTSLIVDEKGVAAIRADLERKGVDVPFDHNHATIFKLRAGEDAPAYGWGDRQSIHFDPARGLICTVNWTEEGQEDIAKKRYRYLSPVVFYNRKTLRVEELHSVALTTKPLTPRAPALAATDIGDRKETRAMEGLIGKVLQAGEPGVATAEQKMGELKIILQQKGVELGDGADFVAIINAAIAAIKGEGGEEKKSEAEEVAATVREKLGLKTGEGKDAVLKALSDLQGHVGYVRADDYQKLQDRLGALETTEKDRQADILVASYLDQGKLNPNDKDRMKWAEDRAKNDPAGFKILMDGAPVIIPQGKTQPPADRPGRGGLNEDQLIEKALTDHEGDYKRAIIAVQRRLIDEECERTGHSRQYAAEALTGRYPKIFGAAA